MTRDVAARPERERSLVWRGLRLEYATLGWNVVGSVVVLAAAVLARSVALAGFGLDSLIEIVASLVVVWQLKGIALTAVAMFALAWAKGHTGRALGNQVLATEARVTLIDGYLALAVLAGLVFNATLGWWWADPLAGWWSSSTGLARAGLRSAWRTR